MSTPVSVKVTLQLSLSLTALTINLSQLISGKHDKDVMYWNMKRKMDGSSEYSQVTFRNKTASLKYLTTVFCIRLPAEQ